jgi:hypothetical protein
MSALRELSTEVHGTTDKGAQQILKLHNSLALLGTQTLFITVRCRAFFTRKKRQLDHWSMDALDSTEPAVYSQNRSTLYPFPGKPAGGKNNLRNGVGFAESFFFKEPRRKLTFAGF